MAGSFTFDELALMRFMEMCQESYTPDLWEAFEKASRMLVHMRPDLREGCFETIKSHLKSQSKCEWLPIESAPRDGTWVILAGGECLDEHEGMELRTVTAQWTNVLNGDVRRGGWWQFAWYDSGYYGRYDNPTHWMPLPEFQYPERKTEDDEED